MRRSTGWPGRFATDLESDQALVQPIAVLLSPILWLTFAVSFALILPWVGTMIHWTDSGELIASAVTLGIPHPTGYPLLSMLSHAMLTLIPWSDPVHLLHLLSAVFVALSAGVVSLLALALPSGKILARHRMVVTGSSIASGLLFTTSITVWSQAVSYEVYGFQAFLYAIILLSVLCAVRDMHGSTERISPWWIFSGCVTGLGFANHMMTLYLIPGLVWYIWRKLGRPSGRMAASFVAAMIGGLSCYAYLFIRAAGSPPLNWGDPSTPANLLAHVSGQQYRIWMFSGWDALVRSAGTFLSSFPDDVGWIALVLSAVGIHTLWSKDRRSAVLVLILFLFTVGYAWNYDIHDIQTYFILAIMSACLAAGIGVRRLLHRYAERAPVASAVMLCLIVIGNGAYRYEKYPDADDESPEPFARSVLQSVPPNAAIITGRWDFLYSPVLALQHVHGMRPDVLAIDLHLLRDRSWYLRALRSASSFAGTELERRSLAFEAELRKFETGDPFMVQVLQQRWTEYLAELLTTLSARGPVLVDHEIVGELPPLFTYAPDGYLLRAYPREGGNGKRGKMPELFSIGRKSDELATSFRQFCSTAFLNHALAARAEGDSAAFREALSLARSSDPSNPRLMAFY